MATLQTKLTLDIPSSIVAPNSPALLASTYDSAPPSPTSFSSSLLFNKSQAELTVLLKDAYAMIREREKDLTLAAEIGKSLLENNMTLKTQYEGAMVQLRNLQKERSKSQNIFSMDYIDQKYIKDLEARNQDLQQQLDDALKEFSDCERSNRSRIRKLESDLAFATQKVEDLERENDLFSKSEEEEEFTEGGKSLTLATEIGKSLLENTEQDYKELEFVKDLEMQNQKLQQRLDETLEEYIVFDESNKSKIYNLELELQSFKDACALATLKIDDLEKEKERLIHKQKQKKNVWYSKNNEKTNEKFTVIKLASSSTYGIPQNFMIV